MTRPASFTVLVALVLLGGCRSFTLEEPADFLELDAPADGYDFRATSADGVVLAVREVTDAQEGSLAFWKDAVRNRIRADRGYALLEERTVEAATGEEGVQLRFGRDRGNQSYAYWVTVFPVEAGVFWFLGIDPVARVLIVEAGGEEEPFGEVEDEVARAIAGFEIH